MVHHLPGEAAKRLLGEIPTYPMEQRFRDRFRGWVPRMKSRPVELEQEFELDFAFEIHDVYMFRLENGKYAVVDSCWEEGDEYDPRYDEIVLYPDYASAFQAFKSYVQKELEEQRFG